MMKQILRSLVVALSLTALASEGSVHAVQPALGQPLERTAFLERFFAPDTTPLVQYRALRRLTASTRGGRLSATIEAWTTLDPVTGFTFQVASEEGSPLIRHRVLMAALAAEQKTRSSSDRDEAALTTVNYDFLDVKAASQHLVQVDVSPKRKHVMRIYGSMFLDEDSADLVRVEGELSKRPSFWTRNVQIMREYRRIDGVHVPIAMNSSADVLIVGTSTFSMTYTYLEINGRHVGDVRSELPALPTLLSQKSR
jgi:hypothetical protein